MILSDSASAKLVSIPNIKMLLLKTAFKKTHHDPRNSLDVSLPTIKYCCDRVELDKTSCKLFHQVTGWELESDIIHPCYLHSLAFPLHIMLLLQPAFPFPLLGLVHVENQIKQMRPIHRNETLAVSSSFGQLELHSKGWLFSINVQFYSGSELVWQSISTNLFRADHGRVVDPKSKSSMNMFSNSVNTPWKLSASLGRRYAKASGDYNPIHLAKWSARLFGFKQHIIHGMWTKSSCISTLQKTTPLLFTQAFQVDSTFKQPLYLPSEVNMAVQPFESDNSANGLYFKVVGIGTNNEPQPLHLIGEISAI